ncbi:MAG TPA: SAM-dependent chlorinase/fluorinase [Gemmataceae bacterium]|nr:SAM-dependent chlorinase/fluorinase [Gemmataceae bacterium]
MPIITLTTDFGLGDHYAGVMKGVILGICPNARIVDITHDCRPYDVSEAAFTIAQAYRYFPPKTVHVVVVDPGVGTERRAILVQVAGQFFVGPDNGVFAFILSESKLKVREVTNGKYFRQPVSQTFHGRDVFAPVAAHLAKGVSAARMGKPIDNYLRPRSLKPERTARRGWTGLVLKVDRFGNLITNFLADEFPRALQEPFEMAVGLRQVNRLAPNYEQFGPGEVFVIVGSSGYLEVSAGQASAAKILGVAAGAPVELTIF